MLGAFDAFGSNFSAHRRRSRQASSNNEERSQVARTSCSDHSNAVNTAELRLGGTEPDPRLRIRPCLTPRLLPQQRALTRSAPPTPRLPLPSMQDTYANYRRQAPFPSSSRHPRPSSPPCLPPSMPRSCFLHTSPKSSRSLSTAWKTSQSSKRSPLKSPSVR